MNLDQAHKLIRLIHFVQELPNDRFYMPDWCSADATKTHCGTAGCIAGWAVTLYHEEGFVFGGPDGYFTPSYQGSTGHYAFARFFGLDTEDALKITHYVLRTEDDMPDGDWILDADGEPLPTRPIDVANRTRIILEKYHPGLYDRTERDRSTPTIHTLEDKP